MHGSALAICTGDFSTSNYPLHTYISENCCPLLIVSVQNKLCRDHWGGGGGGGGNVHTWSDGKVVMV